MVRWSAGSGFVLGALLCAGAVSTAQESGSFEELVGQVRALGIGEAGFVIGERLSASRMEEGTESRVDGAYPGTIQFESGDVMVVADEESGLVLALYRRDEEAAAVDARRMVGHLVNRFGEPTATAHERLIYWAFDADGGIGPDRYEQGKSDGRLEVLATVKFSSSFAVTPGMADEPDGQAGTIYYIITSDRLLERYVGQP